MQSRNPTYLISNREDTVSGTPRLDEAHSSSIRKGIKLPRSRSEAPPVEKQNRDVCVPVLGDLFERQSSELNGLHLLPSLFPDYSTSILLDLIRKMLLPHSHSSLFDKALCFLIW